jgi:class 3 adenylate cyclase/tetratricopeptide (TPR) repeat protein
MAQTKNVTVLFTDLVGSTQLSSSLSPAAADDVRRAHFAVLREAISATGGTEVKNLGDGLMVGFDATAPALSCAVAMQQGIDRHNRRSPMALAVRIGVSTGDVTVEESDFFGEPVVETARLCAVAQGGQILATEAVKILARRSGHSFITERELEMKGLPEPVVAWEVVWEPLEEESNTSGIPLPPRLPQTPAIGLVGRKVELARLTEAFKAVASGEPARTVLILGEAGLGKSTLTATLARDAHQDGAVVLYGRCDEDLAVPYQPFVEALGYYVNRTADDVLFEIGADRLSALIRLVPDIRKRRRDLEPTASSDPDAERWLLYGAVLELLERASRDAPVVFILDDLHWADRPTLQLLRQIASHRPSRLLVLGTYRETDVSASHPLTETLAALTREPSVTRISLSGLDDNDVVSFVEAAAGRTLDDAGVGLAHALYQETDGNPFFMAEVLRHLVETRSIIQEDTGRWVPTQALAEAGLPDSVRQVIGSRVGRLGDQTTRVLSAASVLGQEFDVNLLAAAAGLPEDVVLDVLETASSSALVAEVRGMPGRFRFAHALIQHTLYGDLGETRRARLHAAAANALEDQLRDDVGARAGELARHWLAATRPTESRKAVSYARLAGENALVSLAPAEAIRWFNEALGALADASDENERARCLVGLGEAQRQTGDPEYCDTLLEAASVSRAIGDVDTLVRAALANNRGWQSAVGIVDAKRIEVLNAALSAIGTADSAERCRLLALIALERTYDGDYLGRRAIADEALEMARRLGDAATLLDVLVRRCQPIWRPDTVDELFAGTDEICVLADQLRDRVAKFWALFFRGAIAACLGDLSEVIGCHDELDRLSDEVGQPILRWAACFNRSWSRLLLGDMVQAEALATEALQIGNNTQQPDAIAIYGVQLSNIRWYQGRLPEIVDVFVQIASDNPEIPAFRGAAAWTLLEVGREDEARTMLDLEKSRGLTAPDDFLFLCYLDLWSRVISSLGEQGAAKIVYDQLSPWPDLVGFAGSNIAVGVSHHLATLATVLGRHNDAESHFAHALEIHENLEAPFFIAETKLEWGRMLLVRRAEGDLPRAKEMLTSARDKAQSYGFAAIERRASEALSALS